MAKNRKKFYRKTLNSTHFDSPMNAETAAPRLRGRPKSESPRRTGLLLKFSEDEAIQIEKKAKKAGKPKAVWIREIVLAA
jgi:hypothetical protein